jgi:hypothetical protein
MTAPLAPDPAPQGARLSLRKLRPGLSAVVAVAGAESNAGKTLVAERAIGALASAGRATFVLKTTRTHLDVCPRGVETCGTCDSLAGAYEVVRDLARLRTRGKDTDRYFLAGAAHVRWLLARPDRIAEGILAATADPPEGSTLIAEGNSFLDWCDVDVALMALSPRGFMKPTASYVLDRVDAFVARDPGLLDPPPSPKARVPVLSIDDVGPFVLERLRGVGAPTPSGARRA